MATEQPAQQQQHLLSLKVMRLTRPTCVVNAPVVHNDEYMLLADSDSLYTSLNKPDFASTRNLEQASQGEALCLPLNFGNIFLGESFSSYVSVHNDSSIPVRDMVVKVELQTQTQRITLSAVDATPQNEGKLDPDESFDDIIHHDVKELGVHMLICSVSYRTYDDRPYLLRKLFKFQVQKPLDVRTKFYSTEYGEVFLEAQIQNITPVPIYVERVLLEAVTQFQVREIQQTLFGEKGKNKSVFGSPMLNSQDVRQYLYVLEPRGTATSGTLQSAALAGGANRTTAPTAIGKLDISWKSTMGEKGRLQTSQLQRAASPPGDVRVTILEMPAHVRTETPFVVSLRVANCSERSLELTLTFSNVPSPNTPSGQLANTGNNAETVPAPAVVWSGVSGRRLAPLKAGEWVDVPVTCIALRGGLQAIGGIRLFDPFLKRTYQFDELAHVLVY